MSVFAAPWLSLLAARLGTLATALIVASVSSAGAGAATTPVACDAAALRAAIDVANGNEHPSTLLLAAGCTYTLTEVDNSTEGANGLPVIHGAITIVGNGATIERSRVAAAPQFRLFFVDTPGELTLQGVTLSNGSASDGRPGRADHAVLCHGGAGSHGGGIYNRGTLTVTGSRITGNAAGAGGGAATYCDEECLRRQDGYRGCNGGAGGAGGGIFNEAGLTVTNSTLAGNASGAGGCGADYYGSRGDGGDAGAGGGIFSSGIVRVAGSTLSDNRAGRGGCGDDESDGGRGGDGGGIANSGVLGVVNSTVTGNRAGDAGYTGDDHGRGGTGGSGGGIANHGRLTLSSSTVTDNARGGDAPCEYCHGTDGSPGVAGGIFNSGSFEVANSIIATQYAGADCAGTTPATQRYTVTSDGTCGHAAGPGNEPYGAPQLGPLLHYGGPTFTHPLPGASSAIDRGDPAGCADADGAVLATDQRGLPRRQGGACDPGAFELQPGEEPLEEVGVPLLTALLPLEVWIGLYEGQASTALLDLRAEVYLNDRLIGLGARQDIPAGGNGFAGARLWTIPLDLLSGPKAFSPRDRLSLVIHAGRSCSSSAEAPGAVLWYDDARANSRFGATVDGATRAYFLRGSSSLGTAPGTGPRSASWIELRAPAQAPCRPELQPVGTWAYSPAVGDLNGDGTADILWRQTSGALQAWFVRGNGTTQILGTAPLPSPGSHWGVHGMADFNGDGTADLLWRHRSGRLIVWLMQGVDVVAAGSPGILGKDWTVLGVRDLDGDGKADILWRHASGELFVWLMNGTRISETGSPGAAPPRSTIGGVADLDGDGKADILWRDAAGLTIWFMDGPRPARAGVVGSVPVDGEIIGLGDFDQNGRADIVWRDRAGTVSLWLMDGTTVVRSGTVGVIGSDWSVVGVADYAGFDAANIVWRHTSGRVDMWYVAPRVDFSAHSGRMGSIPLDWQPR
jgi:hypothetical protein